MLSNVFFSLAVNGSVIAAEKKQKSILYDEKTVSKVSIVLYRVEQRGV